MCYIHVIKFITSVLCDTKDKFKLCTLFTTNFVRDSQKIVLSPQKIDSKHITFYAKSAYGHKGLKNQPFRFSLFLHVPNFQLSVQCSISLDTRSISNENIIATYLNNSSRQQRFSVRLSVHKFRHISRNISKDVHNLSKSNQVEPSQLFHLNTQKKAPICQNISSIKELILSHDFPPMRHL